MAEAKTPEYIDTSDKRPRIMVIIPGKDGPTSIEFFGIGAVAVVHNGTLEIRNWENDSLTGLALFPPDEWKHFIRIVPAERTAQNFAIDEIGPKPVA